MRVNSSSYSIAIRRRVHAILSWGVFCALIGAAAFLPGVVSVQAQSQDDVLQAQLQAMLTTYQGKQAALSQEHQALVDGGATMDQLQVWRQQNATRFDAQQRRAQKMSQWSFLKTRQVAGTARTPPSVSPDLAVALATRATLNRAHAQLHNQLVQTLPTNASADQISQVQQQERQLFQGQHGAELMQLSEQAQTLANAPVQPMIVPMPPALQIPANVTPQLGAYLVTRDQLMRQRIQLRNQYAAADPATRQVALQQWRQQNASLLQQLQQQAQALGAGN